MGNGYPVERDCQIEIKLVCCALTDIGLKVVLRKSEKKFFPFRPLISGAQVLVPFALGRQHGERSGIGLLTRGHIR